MSRTCNCYKSTIRRIVSDFSDSSAHTLLGADGKRDPTEAFWQLEIDLEPFNSHFPKLTRPNSIGEGVKFLNRSA